MPVEIEAKFLDIDRDVMRGKLRAAGYDCVKPEYMMRRVVFDLPNGPADSWARVRQEADAVTVSYKRTHDPARVDGTEEIQITADNFDKAVDLMEALGLVRKSYQETKREVWKKGDIEATLDEWPALAPFIEIEAPDETTLKSAAAVLGLSWEMAFFGAVGVVYEKIGISQKSINAAARITFDEVGEVLKLSGR